MDPHRIGVERSLALHREVVRRLRDGVDLVAPARAQLDRWSREQAVHTRYAEQWAALLALPLEDLFAALEREGEPMQTLRSVTPFAGLIEPRTRWAIWAETRDRVDA